jgi:DNA primase
MHDFDDLKASHDLLALVEQDLGKGRRSGRWWMFSCPFPGHANADRHPSLAVTPDNGRWHCFTCGRSGDVVSWLRQYRELPWDIIFQLNSDDLLQSHQTPTLQEVSSGPPSEAWQTQGKSVVCSGEYVMWKPEAEMALSWLHKRGLTDSVIRHYHLGYNRYDTYQKPEHWGLKGSRIWLPRGIVIPTIVKGELWNIKFRRPTGIPKYVQPRGGRSALFGADDLPGSELVLLTEGELDCVLAGQHLGDVLGAATLGSALQHLDLRTWGPYLLPARLILAVYDLDPAGQSGSEQLGQLSARIHRLQLPALRPGDKDLTDFVRSGGQPWEWLVAQLRALGSKNPLSWPPPEEMVIRELEG